MREEPPQELIALVERLGLATAEQIRGMGPRARGLARGLPLFESVWLDALAQARIVTHFQADEIRAGRGDALRVGPYVLCRRLPSPDYGDCYVAQEVDSGQMARLVVVPTAPEQASAVVGRLGSALLKREELIAQIDEG